MERGEEKYNKILNLLKKSTPLLNSTGEIESEVIRRVKKLTHSGINISDVIDFLFGWIYIGWVRRSLIAASVVLVMIFVYQQSVILKRIDAISRQTIVTDKGSVTTSADQIEKMMTVYKMTGRIFRSKTTTITERQMKELLETVKELQAKYRDLEDLIEGDPQLKRLFEQKLIDSNRNKINL
jgi:hypothetical protein